MCLRRSVRSRLRGARVVGCGGVGVVALTVVDAVGFVGAAVWRGVGAVVGVAGGAAGAQGEGEGEEQCAVDGGDGHRGLRVGIVGDAGLWESKGAVGWEFQGVGGFFGFL